MNHHVITLIADARQQDLIRTAARKRRCAR
jgi:hypothetical protein